MTNDLVDLIQRCAREVAEQEGISLGDEFDADSTLFGPDGFFDSLGLVNLVVVVEEAVQERFGQAVTLADERAMSRSTSPFRNVNSLASYTAELIRESE